MNTKITQEMIDYCRALGNGKVGPKIETAGLFVNFYSEFASDLSDLIDFSLYPECECPSVTGFPIRHDFLFSSVTFQYSRDLWDKRTIYGQNRRHLCRWVADELERQKKSQEEIARYSYEIYKNRRAHHELYNRTTSKECN